MIQTISLDDLREAMLQKKGTLLDVREIEEYEAGHIPGAHHLPLSSLEENLSSLEKERQYFVICQVGRRSETACQYLEQKGFHVANVIEGMVAYDGELE